MTHERIADSRFKATGYMRQHFHRNYKELAGYAALEEFVAFLYRAADSEEDYEELKEDALIVTLEKVRGRRFLEELGENTVIADKQDVLLAMKELLKAAGHDGKFDDFIIESVFK